jgi:Flp pilus assembly protein TadB
MRSEAVLLFIFVLIAILVVIVVALYLRHRNLQMFHQERLAALEKGTAVPIGHTLAPWSPRVYLLRGLLWSFGGAALVISLLGIAVSTRRPLTAENTLYRAQYLAQGAKISLEEAKQIVEKDREAKEQGMPSSVALFGLIPLAVGLAYLVFYYTGQSRRVGHVPPVDQP